MAGYWISADEWRRIRAAIRRGSGPVEIAPGRPKVFIHVTTEELAEELRTSPETVRYWRQVGKGPKSFKVGRRVLYAREDVDAWVQAASDE